MALLREHGPAVGAEQLAALEAERAALAAAGQEERARELNKVRSPFHTTHTHYTRL